VSAFARPVTLSLHYTPQQIGDLTEERLALFYRDPANGKWRRATSQVDTNEHVIRTLPVHILPGVTPAGRRSCPAERSSGSR
jgi:hypothetical protein